MEKVATSEKKPREIQIFAILLSFCRQFWRNNFACVAQLNTLI